MKNKWISYKELKNRWQHIFETDQEFLPLRHELGLFAFKYDMPERESDLGGEDPFVSFTPQTAHDLQECWFMLEHIEMREHSYGESGPIYADQSPATWEKLAREKWANTHTEPFPGIDALRLDGELEVFHLPKSVGPLAEQQIKEKDYVFHKEGTGGWGVKFKEESYSLKHLPRVEYVATLLKNKVHGFYPNHLDRRVKGLCLEDMGPEPGEELSIKDLQIEHIPKEEVEVLAEKIAEIHFELQAARDKGVEVEIKKQEEIFLKAREYYETEYGIFVYEKNGRLVYKRKKRLSKEAEKIRHSVRKNIDRTLEDLKKPMPQLYEHLKKCIRYKNFKFFYQPDQEDIDWYID